MRRSTWMRLASDIFRPQPETITSCTTIFGVSARTMMPSACSDSLVARAMEGRAQLLLCRDAISATNTVVCRLTAGIEAMQQRVHLRESGVSQRAYVDRVENLSAILDRVRLEDFPVINENRSVTDVAMEMLVKAGWISN
jgi:precorrin-2 methylase